MSVATSAAVGAKRLSRFAIGRMYGLSPCLDTRSNESMGASSAVPLRAVATRHKQQPSGVGAARAGRGAGRGAGAATAPEQLALLQACIEGYAATQRDAADHERQVSRKARDIGHLSATHHPARVWGVGVEGVRGEGLPWRANFVPSQLQSVVHIVVKLVDVPAQTVQPLARGVRVGGRGGVVRNSWRKQARTLHTTARAPPPPSLPRTHTRTAPRCARSPAGQCRTRSAPSRSTAPPTTPSTAWAAPARWS